MQIIKTLLLLKMTVTPLTAAPGRQFYRRKEDKKRHPAPPEALQTSARSHCLYSRLCSRELGKGSCHHTDTAPQGTTQSNVCFQCLISREEKITSKSFLAVSEIKIGPAHEAQQMSQEPAVTQNIWWWPKPAQGGAVSHLKPFHSRLSPVSPDRALSLCTSSKLFEIQHGLLPPVCCLLWYL